MQTYYQERSMSDSNLVLTILHQVADRCQATPSLDFDIIHEIFLDADPLIYELPADEEALIRGAIQQARAQGDFEQYGLRPNSLEAQCFDRVLSLLVAPPGLL
jgi:hypothetical protein